jgi:hypothetical protein
VALLLVIAGAATWARLPQGQLSIALAGAKGEQVPSTELTSFAFTVSGSDHPRVSLDGAPLTGTREGSRTVFHPTGLKYGPHTITASAPSSFGRRTSATTHFTIGAAPATATTAAGTPAPSAASGRDAAGAPIGMRGVHMTGIAWATPSLRDPVLAMIKDHRIDTVELDIRDEDGAVNYNSEVRLAKQLGDTHNYYDPKQVVSQLHAMGVRVVGRLVTFQDPVLAKWAWANGHQDWDLHTRSGDAYQSPIYGRQYFPNLADPDVTQFSIDLAAEAAGDGFDDIMYDFVRIPGTLSTMVLPGLDGRDPQDVIAEFLARSRTAVHAKGAKLAAAVFGVSVFAPTETAQNIPRMARNLDYVAPMIYPSHWGHGEYGVPVPNSAPYDIVSRSLKDYNTAVLGTGAQVIPWLQDFTMGRPAYGPDEVAAQIKAAHEGGINSFLLWNAGCKFQPAAEQPGTAGPAGDLPGQLVYSVDHPGVASQGTSDRTRAEQVAAAERPDVEANMKAAGIEVTPATPAPTSSPTPGTQQPRSGSSATPSSRPDTTADSRNPRTSRS